MVEEPKVFEVPKVCLLLGSLKGGAGSNSRKLASMLISTFKEHKLPIKEVVLAAAKIKPGIKVDLGDDFKAIAEEIDQSDIVIFVTPIWWGEASSLIQSVIERLDEIDEKHRAGKPHPYLGKVFGVVVSGTDDGSQAIISRLNGWASHLGFTIPPFNSFSYLGDPKEAMKDKKQIKIAETTAANLVIAAVHSKTTVWVS